MPPGISRSGSESPSCLPPTPPSRPSRDPRPALPSLQRENAPRPRRASLRTSGGSADNRSVAADVARRFGRELGPGSVLDRRAGVVPRPRQRGSPRRCLRTRRLAPGRSCGTSIEGREPMVVPDVMQHPVFSKARVPAGGNVARLRRRTRRHLDEACQRCALRIRLRAARPGCPRVDALAETGRRLASSSTRPRTSEQPGAVLGLVSSRPDRSSHGPREPAGWRRSVGARSARARAVAAA